MQPLLLRNDQAGPYTPMQMQALDKLDDDWGAEYDLWLCDTRFEAQRRGDDRGEILDGATPEELDTAIRATREVAADETLQAALRAFEARRIDVYWTGFWQAVIEEDLGHVIVSRDGLPQLLGRLAEMDAAGMLPA